jgi:hypothetical protein
MFTKETRTDVRAIARDGIDADHVLLTPGTRLGPYTIESLIGYRARRTRAPSRRRHAQGLRQSVGARRAHPRRARERAAHLQQRDLDAAILRQLLRSPEPIAAFMPPRESSRITH